MFARTRGRAFELARGIGKDVKGVLRTSLRGPSVEALSRRSGTAGGASGSALRGWAGTVHLRRRGRRRGFDGEVLLRLVSSALTQVLRLKISWLWFHVQIGLGCC